MISKIRFLGVDQSFTSSGYVILDENDNIIDFGRICTTSEHGDVFDRAWLVAKTIGMLYQAHNPTFVGIEGLAFSKFGDATRDLAGLQFTIVNYLQYVVHCPKEKIIIPSPNEIKKFATGKGNANKDLMVASLPKEVVKLFETRNYKKTTGLTDVTDSYWISKIILAHYLKYYRREHQTA